LISASIGWLDVQAGDFVVGIVKPRAAPAADDRRYRHGSLSRTISRGARRGAEDAETIGFFDP
jgi:hypothetical protein